MQDSGLGLDDFDFGDMNMDQLMQQMGGLQDMWKGVMDDPEMMKQLSEMGEVFGEAIQELSKMSPEELEKQMKDAFNMLTDGDMAETVIGKREDVLAALEASGMVDADDLAKLKADPEYFDQKMRESFGQMAEILSDPEVLKATAGAFQSSQNMINDMTKAFTEDLDSDEDIEAARLELLNNPELMNNPIIKTLFEDELMDGVLKDPEKFRNTVKLGSEKLKQGAGIGEL